MRSRAEPMQYSRIICDTRHNNINKHTARTDPDTKLLTVGPEQLQDVGVLALGQRGDLLLDVVPLLASVRAVSEKVTESNK